MAHHFLVLLPLVRVVRLAHHFLVLRPPFRLVRLLRQLVRRPPVKFDVVSVLLAL